MYEIDSKGMDKWMRAVIRAARERRQDPDRWLEQCRAHPRFHAGEHWEALHAIEERFEMHAGPEAPPDPLCANCRGLEDEPLRQRNPEGVVIYECPAPFHRGGKTAGEVARAAEPEGDRLDKGLLDKGLLDQIDVLVPKAPVATDPRDTISCGCGHESSIRPAYHKQTDMQRGGWWWVAMCLGCGARTRAYGRSQAAANVWNLGHCIRPDELKNHPIVLGSMEIPLDAVLDGRRATYSRGVPVRHAVAAEHVAATVPPAVEWNDMVDQIHKELDVAIATSPKKWGDMTAVERLNHLDRKIAKRAGHQSYTNVRLLSARCPYCRGIPLPNETCYCLAAG